GPVDTVEGNHAAVLQVDYREAATCRIAAQDCRVVAKTEADRLQLEIVLVRPEPGHRLVGLRIAANGPRRRVCHVVGVLHAFESDNGSVRPDIAVGRAVADRINIGQAGATKLVDIDAVGAGRAGGEDRKSTRLNSSHVKISYAVFCLKKKRNEDARRR